MRLDSMFDLDTYNKLVNMWKKAEISILDMSYTINGDSGIMKYTNNKINTCNICTICYNNSIK